MADQPVPGELLTAWQAEETGPSEGWDFSQLRGRMTETAEPWDLNKIYREAIALSRHVLDMGTGGGEFLRTFTGVLPRDTVATEGWPPNLPVAKAALEPYGINVVSYDADAEPWMPFGNDRFDLVLNRHETFDASEVARVLMPGGMLVTQQVGGSEVSELHALTGKKPDHPEVTYDRMRERVTEAGLEIVDGDEDNGWYEFADVAALVAYLQLVPWDVPDDFSVVRYQDALWQLHQSGPAVGKPIRLTRIRFWLRARKPIR